MSYYIMTLYVEPAHATGHEPEITAEVLVELSDDIADASTEAFNLGIDALKLRHNLDLTIKAVGSKNLSRTAVSGREGLPEPLITNETGKAWILSEK